MRVLLDECIPRKFKSSISRHGHTCQTVPEAGFSGKRNGELLTLAEGKFDIFLTLDQGIEYEQNLTGRMLSIIVIFAKSSRFVHVDQHTLSCVEAMRSIQPGQLTKIGNVKAP